MNEFDNAGSAATQEDRTLAMLTHLSGIILGFIVPLVIWLTNKDKSDKGWLNDQAKEALNFNITLLIVGVILFLITLVTFGIGVIVTAPLGLLVFIAWLVLTIIAAVKANDGIAYRYPFALRLVK